MADDKDISSYLFFVEIDGIETARFQKCEGLEAETSVFEYEEGGGEVHHFKGRTRFPNIILEKGITDNDSLFNWFKDTCLENKKLERKNGSVVLKDLQDNEVKRWNFFRAFPCRWIGPKLDYKDPSTFAVERIEIAHEGIEVDNDSEPQEYNNWFHIGRDMSEETNFIGAEEASTDEMENAPTNVIEYQTPTDPNDYHCDIYAWNGALDHDADPRDQNGEEWDGNELSVSQIYERYPNNRHYGAPPSNTRGYVFYDSPNDDDTVPEHMEFYDNRNSEEGHYTLYSTIGIDTPIPQDRSGTDPHRVFVTLDDLPGDNTP